MTYFKLLFVNFSFEIAKRKESENCELYLLYFVSWKPGAKLVLLRLDNLDEATSSSFSILRTIHILNVCCFEGYDIMKSYIIA